MVLLVCDIPEEQLHKSRELTAIGNFRRKLCGSSRTIRMTKTHQVTQTRSLRHLQLKQLCEQLKGVQQLHLTEKKQCTVD